MIDNETVWFDMEQDFGRGRTPLLVASISGGHIEPSIIRLLLQRGANVAARDHNGYTCLHLALSESCDRWQLKESLILLVEAGANIHAVDNNGYSVSQYAIEFRVWDSWEYALRACGKDINQVRAEMREKGHCLRGVRDCGKSSKCGGLCLGKSESDSEHSESDISESDEDECYNEEGDAQHDIYRSEARNEVNDSLDGLESDSDCSMGGVELSFGAL